jgi:predicted ATPase
MIRHWEIKNFKSIKESMGYLEFAPITLFAGANSSGKSSVIQSILLIMQSIAMRESVSLLLNGELISLGTVEDVWNNGILEVKRKPVHLEYKIEIDDQTRDNGRVGLDLVFSAISGTKVSLMSANYRFISEVQDLPYEMTIERSHSSYTLKGLTPAFEKSIRERLEQEGLQDLQSFLKANIDMEGLFPRSFDITAKVRRRELNWDNALIDPFDVRIQIEDLKEQIPKKYKKIVRRIVNQLNLSGFIELTTHKREVERVNTLGEYQNWFGNLPNRQSVALCDHLSSSLKDLLIDEKISHPMPFVDNIDTNLSTLALQNIRYLGANRIAPTVIFSPDITSQWSEVGVNGANVATAIQEQGRKSILWYDPEQFITMETSLIQALVTWLRFFGLLDDVRAEEQGKLGTMLKIRSDGVDRDLDLTSVGFGTSQLLPIIVQGLLTPPGGVFIVEQPEVHLHPHVQSQLAIFFVALTRAKVQCIIETHSENLVNQLRLFIADRRYGLHEDIKMYFAQRDKEIGTFFEEVDIDRRGDIKNWPDGFMDESTNQAEAMLRAILEDED